MPKAKFNVEEFVRYDKISNKSICLIETCKKELCGKLISNIKRHYKLVHKQDIESRHESDSEEVSKKSKKIKEIKLRTTMDKDDFLKCCVGLVTKKNFPFKIFDDKECFKQLIAPYEQKFKINLSSNNIDAILEKSGSYIKSEISATIKNKMICLKIDTATRMETNILGINIQYIKGFKMCINTIGVIQATKYTNLKEEILKCLEEFNIGMLQIYAIITDNGAGALRLEQSMREQNIEKEEFDIDVTSTNQIESNLASGFSIVRCAAHTVQLAAYDVIKNLEDDIDECRKIVKKLQTSVRSENDEIVLSCLDVSTRWHSTYSMINKVLSLKEFIMNLETFDSININWMFIQNFVEAFKLLEKCVLKLQQEQYVLGDFFRDWLTCELELEEIGFLNTYATALLSAMRSRKFQLFQQDTFNAAIYLDPRFNFSGTPFLTDDRKQSALEHLLKVHEMINKLTDIPIKEEFMDIPCSPSSSHDSDIPTTTSSAYGKLDHHVQSLLSAQKVYSQSHTASVKQKLIKLCERERVPFDTNVLQYWRNLHSSDKEMTQIVETVLAVPTTQATMERSFNALSTILTKQSSMLSKKSLSNLLIVKLNYELTNSLNFDDEEHTIYNEFFSDGEISLPVKTEK